VKGHYTKTNPIRQQHLWGWVHRGEGQRILKLLEIIEAGHPLLSRALARLLVDEYRFDVLMDLPGFRGNKK